MFLYIIPLAIIAVSLAIIVFIVVKNFSNLAAINIESIAKEKESKVINRIMTERLSRNLANIKDRLGVVLKPLAKKIGKTLAFLFNKVLELEKQAIKNTRLNSAKPGPLKQIDSKQEIKDRLEKARQLIADNKFEKAEEVIVSALELDLQHPDSYELLVEIYTETKAYKKARETCRYLIKIFNKNKAVQDGSPLRHRLANSYANLGFIYELEGKKSQALTNYQKAVDLESSNPRFLDLLLKISIILENKPLALEVFESLKKADPDNGKLNELYEAINSIKST